MQSAGVSHEGGGRKRACKRDARTLPGNSYPVINPKNRRMTNPGNAQMRASIRAMTITLPVFHVLLKNLQTVHLTRSVSSLSLVPTIFYAFLKNLQNICSWQLWNNIQDFPSQFEGWGTFTLPWFYSRQKHRCYHNIIAFFKIYPKAPLLSA